MREKREERENAELENADSIFTALKWLARETGAGYEDSPEELNDAVFDPFWKTMPDRKIVRQAEIDVAYQATISAFEQYTEEEVSPYPAPSARTKTTAAAAETDFTCRACGWQAPDGAFGAIFLADQIQGTSTENREKE